MIFRREFAAYFSTPLAAVFLAVFVAVSSGMTFFVSNFFDRGQADLSSFFTWQPWLFLVLMPAVGMRLWAEERRLGTIELLMTLPVAPWKFVFGKWLAAFAFAGLALVFTMPLWITVNVLGSPDNGVILASYLGAWLMAGAFLAIASCVSALTKKSGARLYRRGDCRLSFRDGGFRSGSGGRAALGARCHLAGDCLHVLHRAFRSHYRRGFRSLGACFLCFPDRLRALAQCPDPRCAQGRVRGEI